MWLTAAVDSTGKPYLDIEEGHAISVLMCKTIVTFECCPQIEHMQDLCRHSEANVMLFMYR